MGNTKYIYIIYDRNSELYLAEFYNLRDVAKYTELTVGTIKTFFSRQRTKEAATKKYKIYREKINRGNW